MTVRAAIIAIIYTSMNAETLYCSTWQGIKTCSSPGGYVSHETQWQGRTNGSDNSGNRWTTSCWQGRETTTVWPRPER